LAGALVSTLFNWRKARLDVALAELRAFLDRTPEIGEALRLLRRSGPLTFREASRVVAIGNWFDVLARLYCSQHVDQELLNDLGVPEVMRTFCTVAESNASGSEVLKAALQNWRYLREVSR
jgi:hypothetical protein